MDKLNYLYNLLNDEKYCNLILDTLKLTGDIKRDVDNLNNLHQLSKYVDKDQLWLDNLKKRERCIDMYHHQYEMRRIFLEMEDSVLDTRLPLYKKLIKQKNSWFKDPFVKERVEKVLSIDPLGMDQKKFIEKNGEENENSVVKLYLPKYKIEINPNEHVLLNTVDKFKTNGLVELVNKNHNQKLIMEVENDITLLKESLGFFLNSKKLKSRIIDADVEDNYEIILPDLIVTSSNERLAFVNEFKEFLNKLNMEDLSSNVKNEMNDIEEYPGHEQWKSVSNMYTNGEIEEAKKHLVTHNLNDGGTIIYITNYYNSIVNNGSINGNNVNITNNNYEKTEKGFVDHIKQNKPEWFVPNKWMSISTFYEEYLRFGLKDRKNHFARKFEKILWSEKRVNSKNRKTEYKCVNLW